MRSMASGGAVHRAYTNAIQQAILEAHDLAFAYFGGVFATLRDDNLGLAVKKILRGYQRHETERMLGFRSHWGFQSEYCNPAHGNEKGGVENELGWFRRNWLAPVPEAADLMAFNRQLLDWCMATAVRVITGRATSVGVAMGEERPQLLPLADLGFDRSEILFPGIVVGKGSGGVGTGSGRGREGSGRGACAPRPTAIRHRLGRVLGRPHRCERLGRGDRIRRVKLETEPGRPNHLLRRYYPWACGCG